MPGLFSAAALAPYVQQAIQEQATQPLPLQEEKETGMSLAAIIALLAGQGADIGTTLAMVPQDRFREGNRLGLPTVLAVKAGLMALPWLTKKFGLPRTPSNIMGYGVGAAGAVPAAMNLRTLARAPER